MNKFLIILTTINGFLFFLIGLLWVISPYDTASIFGITILPIGLGLSSLIGDIGSYFLCIGVMMILAAYTLNSIWFYAPALLLGSTAVLRFISWSMHDANFATQFIIVEILIVTLLLVTARRIQK